MNAASSLTPPQQTLLESCRTALALFQATPTNELREAALGTQRALAESIAGLEKRALTTEFVKEALTLARSLRNLPFFNPQSHADALALARQYASARPAGLLAAALLVPAYAIHPLPALDDVPDSIWGQYAAWIFDTPETAATREDSDTLNAHRSKHTQALARWVERNAGALCVREAGEAYLASPMATGAVTDEELQGRGRILSALFLRNVTRYASTPLPRDGRPLKIGVVVQSFAPTSEAQNLRPLFELADFSRAEIHLFTFEPADDTFAQLCASRAHALQTLPISTDEQLSILRAVGLDVLIYFRDRLVRSIGDIARLALHRVAPLQVAYSPSGKGTGLPEIDLVMAPRSTAPAPAANIGERIGALPLDTPVYVIRPAPEPSDDFSRQSLGIADDTTVYVSAIDGMVAVETRRAWARILAETPRAILILQQTEQPLDAQASAAITTAFLQTLAEADVAADRFALSDFREHSEMLATLRLGDVYLESLANPDQRWTAEALALGLPVIASTLSAPLLKAANAPEWIARDSEEYIHTAVHAGTHTDERRQASQQIRETVENYTEFSDTLAATDACTALLETIYDELATAGHARFRKNSAAFVISPLANAAETLRSGQAALDAGDTYRAGLFAAELLKANPRDTAARLLYGRGLFNEGNTPRAITYLLAAVQATPDNAGAWYTLAQALHLNLQTSEAISALETCLRLDETHTDAWLLLAELAESAGAIDLARDALEALKQLSPGNPQVTALADRLAG